MKKKLTAPFLLAGLFMMVLFTSSFSVEYNVTSREDNPPPAREHASKAEQKQEQRKLRLTKRLKKTKNKTRRKAIQKKIRKIESRQDDGFGSPIVGIIGLILSVLGFILMILTVYSIFAAIAAAVAAGLNFVNWSATIAILIGGFVASIGGIGTSIASLVLNSQDPDKHTMKGFGVAGIIVGSIALVFLLIWALIISLTTL